MHVSQASTPTILLQALTGEHSNRQWVVMVGLGDGRWMGRPSSFHPEETIFQPSSYSVLLIESLLQRPKFRNVKRGEKPATGWMSISRMSTPYRVSL
jgi:hypothetical protein